MAFPIAFYKTLLVISLTYENQSKSRQIFGFVSIFLFIVLWVLQVLWYKLILVGLLKMLGIIKSSKKTSKTVKSD